jgi:hypothetical protein
VFNLTAAGVIPTVPGGSVAVGREVFDGNGNVTGTRDENKGGVVASDESFSGTYITDTNGLGRGVLTIAGDPHPKSFYLVSPGEGFIADQASYESGMFELQSGQPFSAETLSGDFALGTLPWNFNWRFSPVSGVFTADGAGGLAGTSDGMSGTGIGFSGNYATASDGRTTMTTTTHAESASNWLFYVVSPAKAVGIRVDAGVTDSAIRVFEK